MLLDEIAYYLEYKQIGTVGVDIFKSILPDQPNSCIALFEYGGSAPEYAYGVNIERPGLQIRVRNKDYSIGRIICKNILSELHNLRNTLINGVYYTRILANQSPIHLGRDASSRDEWSINFSITKEG